MSHTQSPSTDAAASRGARHLLRGFAANLTGRGDRGPDHADDRRVPRRNSYEENDPRAKPWSRIGDGSVLQGIIHKEALVEVADELRLQLWREYPLADIRQRRQDRDVLAAELEELLARSPADVPAGRPATLRTAIADHDAWLERANGRVRPIDVQVLRGLLSCLTDFVEGKLYPTLETIAAKAGCHYNSVVAGLRRLRAHGLVDWVRRTTRTGNAGEFGPQLEQTSNAYAIAPKARMADRTQHRYLQRLGAKLKRLIRPEQPNPATAAHPPLPAPAAPLTPFQAALASLGSSVANANT